MASTVSKLRKRCGFSEKRRASSLPGLGELCRRFSLDEIKTATHNFNKELILGKGSVGTVYKGFIDEGLSRPVAIKVDISAEEFRTETLLLCQIHHVHILPFIGYCTDKGQRILVYDFMAKNTLHHRLYATDKALCLPWKQRLQICIGAARGLHYLHTGLKYPVIHRNVTTTNILLDEKWVAKVADFGFSKQVAIRFNPVEKGRRGTLDVGFSEQIPGNTTTIYNDLSGERVPIHPDPTTVSTRMVGTIGFMAPEIVCDIGHPPITEKSDVYSFGMVLFHVLCGRKVGDLHLVTGTRGCNKDGSIGKVIDPNLKGKIAPESYEVYLEVATTCVQLDPIQRSTMLDVMEKLELALELQKKADAEGEKMITSES